MIRITQRAVVQNSLRGLNSNLSAYNKLQQQLTSGTTISKPSDSPTGTNTSLITRQSISGNNQYGRNISDGQSFLDSTDSAIQDMLAQVRKVRDLTVQALNGGAQSQQSSDAIATEVSGIRESMLGQANQVVQGRPLFGGVTTGNKAYDPTTGAYVGVGDGSDARTKLTRRVSDVETIRVDLTGPEAFGDPTSGKDMFAVINNVAAHAADPTALTGDLKDLDTAINGLLAAAADVGTRSARMQTAGTVNTSQALNLKTQLSTNEDVDLPKTIMELQMRQTGYQAALQVTAQVMQPTLLDFLK
jgi:flagellar hook-associated protein 3 FlgL